ncbi:MAG: GNAT family N-acetyltransferase [Sphingobacteriaceae bacterium]|nr:GNAT family N-acetyltransferase [Cytophagaceae bacterium]
MPEPQIRFVRPNEAEVLAELGRQTYIDHFADLWADVYASPYLTTHFDPATLRTQLAADGPTYYLWLLAEDVPQGFAKLNRRSTLPTDPTTVGLELEKIYFLKTATGRGYGSALMSEIIAQARRWAEPFVWLDVLKTKEAGRRMYERVGFAVVGELPFSTDKLNVGMWMMRKEAG